MAAAAVSAQDLTRSRDCRTRGCIEEALPGSEHCVKHADAGAPRLVELAETARREHRSAGVALVTALAHGIRCGEALIQARPLVEPLKITWGEWLEKNVGLSLDWAGNYVRLAAFKDELPPAAFRVWVDRRGRLRDPTVSHALTFLVGMPPNEHHWSRRAVDAETRAAVLASLEEGLSFSAAAKRHGLSTTTVKRLRDPNWNEQGREESNANRRAGRRERSQAEQAAFNARVQAGLAVAPAGLADAREHLIAAVGSLASVGEENPEALRYARTAFRYVERALADLAPS